MHLLEAIWILCRLHVIFRFVISILIGHFDNVVFDKIFDHSFEKDAIVLLLIGETEGRSDVLDHGAEGLERLEEELMLLRLLNELGTVVLVVQVPVVAHVGLADLQHKEEPFEIVLGKVDL